MTYAVESCVVVKLLLRAVYFCRLCGNIDVAPERAIERRGEKCSMVVWRHCSILWGEPWSGSHRNNTPSIRSVISLSFCPPFLCTFYIVFNRPTLLHYSPDMLKCIYCKCDIIIVFYFVLPDHTFLIKTVVFGPAIYRIVVSLQHLEWSCFD